MMNRRKFLAASLAATTGGILVAADVLSAKTFFLPPAGGWWQPSVYGTSEARLPGGESWDDRYSIVQMRVRSDLPTVGDLVDVNGKLYRVIASRAATASGSGWPEITQFDLAVA